MGNIYCEKSVKDYPGLEVYLSSVYADVMNDPLGGKSDLPSVRFEVLSIDGLSIDKNLSNVPKYIDKLRKYFNFENQSDELMPTITIGIEDIFDKDWESGPVFDIFNIDPRYAWIDSCIWCRYIQLTDTFEADLKKLLAEIKLYCQLGMYNTVVARENLDLMVRTLRQNFISELNSGRGGGHAKDITPYLYHSESRLRKQAQVKYEELKEHLDSSVGKPIWRCLLVDDHTDIKLTPYTDKAITNSVHVLLKQLLNGISEKATLRDFQSYFKFVYRTEADLSVNYIEFALKMIKNIEKEEDGFELIILDYLLKQGGDAKSKEKGTDLLIKLNDKEKNIAGKCLYRGPSDRFWIIPLTAHSTAFQDELIVQGMPHYDKDWCIAEGADLVLTPNKFLWMLLSTLNIQLKESLFEFKDIDQFFETHPYESKNQKDKDNLQGWALNALGCFVNRFGKHTRFMMGIPVSGFGELVHKYYKDSPELRFYYKSFVNLLMLFSSGSKNDWREMYERITRIEKKLTVEERTIDYGSITGTFKEIKKVLEKWAASAR